MTPGKSKETVLVLTVAFLALGLLFHRPIFHYIGLAVGLSGALSNTVSDWVDFAWTRLSFLIARVSNGVLLTLVFLFVVTPVGLLRRLAGKNNLTRFRPGKNSNLVERDHVFGKEDLDHTW